MGVRRDRPAGERGGKPGQLLLRDGTTVSVSVPELGKPEAGDVCCFCGEVVEYSDPRHVRLTARWPKDGNESVRSWDAHDTCLAEHMHDRVKGSGVFPDLD
jgi:hypothetical protein